MKRVLLISGIGGLVLGALLVWAGTTTTPERPDRRARAVKEFMRDKLELSQKLLEGLTVENYEVIASSAQRLSAMSQEATWQVFENPDYVQYSVDFRKHVNALRRAALKKDLDGATLAYVRVTMSCVDCHKYVRGRLVAQAGLPGMPTELSLWRQSRAGSPLTLSAAD
jgi:cytochrome c556